MESSDDNQTFTTNDTTLTGGGDEFSEFTSPLPQIPGYEVEKLLGQGAFGSVWLARRERSGQLVAVKLLRNLGRQGLLSLQTELNRLGELSEQSHVVHVLDADLAHEPPYLVTPFYARGSLSEYPTQVSGLLPLEQVVGWLEQLVSALVFTHSLGILHCDLKPSNLLLDDDGHLRLADFGQSIRLQDGTFSWGTLGYMAPEQARRDAQPSVSWDIYGFGATAYYLLTKQRPRLTNQQVKELSEPREVQERLTLYREMVGTSNLVNPENLYPSLDRELADLVKSCLSPSPTNRPQTMISVLESLKARNSMMRERMRQALVLEHQALAALNSNEASLGYLYWCELLARRPDDELLRRRLKPLESLESREGPWVFHAATLPTVLVGVQKSVLSEDLRFSAVFNDTGLYLQDASSGDSFKRMTHGATPITDATFSADGSILFVNDGRQLRYLMTDHSLAEIEDRGVLNKVVSDKLTAVASSPTGSLLALGLESGRVIIYDFLRSAMKIKRLSPRLRTSGPLRSIKFSPDETRFAALTGKSVHIFGVRDWTEIVSPFNSKDMIWSMTFTKDWSRMAVASGRLTEVRDLSTGRTLSKQEHANEVYVNALSEDGKTLASGGEDGYLRLWDVDSGGDSTLAVPHGRSLASVQISPDARFIATTDEAGRIWVWESASGRLCSLFPTQVNLNGAYFIEGKEQVFALAQTGRVGYLNFGPTTLETSRLRLLAEKHSGQTLESDVSNLNRGTAEASELYQDDSFALGTMTLTGQFTMATLPDPTVIAKSSNLVPAEIVRKSSRKQLESAPLVLGYLLERKLGEGTSGTVWAAVQERTGQRVAVEVLVPKLFQDWQAYKASAAVIARISNHPYIVQILDSDLDSNPPFVVSPYFSRGSLASAGQVSHEQALEWLKMTASALEHLHSNGVFHGNLKPSNVLLDGEGTIRLTDFGAVDLSAVPWKQDNLELSYLPPERIQGEPPDNRWDVFSFGALACFLVAGRVPDFSVEHDLRAVLSHFNSRHKSLIERCLSSDPQKRPESGIEIHRYFLDSERTETEDDSRVQYHLRQALRAEIPAHKLLHRAHALKLQPDNRDAKEALASYYLACRHTSEQSLSAHPSCFAVSPDGELYAIGFSDGTCECIAFQKGRVVIQHRTVARPLFARSLILMEFSGCGGVLAAVNSAGELFVWDTAREALSFQPCKTKLVPTCLALSPNGQYLALGGKCGKTIIFDARDGTVDREISSEGPTHQVQFLDSEALIIAGDDCTLRAWDLRTGETLWTHRREKAIVSCQVLRGQIIAAASSDGVAVIIDSRTGWTRSFFRSQSAIISLALSPCGGFLLTGGEDGNAAVWNTKSGRLEVAVAHAGPVERVVFHPEGECFATACADRFIRIWSLEGLLVAPEFPRLSEPSVIAFSPNGAEFLLGGKRSLRFFSLEKESSDPVTVAELIARSSLTASGELRNWEEAEFKARHQRFLLSSDELAAPGPNLPSKLELGNPIHLLQDAWTTRRGRLAVFAAPFCAAFVIFFQLYGSAYSRGGWQAVGNPEPPSNFYDVAAQHYGNAREFLKVGQFDKAVAEWRLATSWQREAPTYRCDNLTFAQVCDNWHSEMGVLLTDMWEQKKVLWPQDQSNRVALGRAVSDFGTKDLQREYRKLLTVERAEVASRSYALIFDESVPSDVHRMVERKLRSQLPGDVRLERWRKEPSDLRGTVEVSAQWEEGFWWEARHYDDSELEDILRLQQGYNQENFSREQDRIPIEITLTVEIKPNLQVSTWDGDHEAEATLRENYYADVDLHNGSATFDIDTFKSELVSRALGGLRFPRYEAWH